MGARVAVVLVQILFDDVLEFFPVIVLFCLLRFDLVPLFGAEVRFEVIVEVSTLGIIRL